MWTRSWILRWLPLAALAAGTACSPPPSRVAVGDGARAVVTLADGWRFTRMDVPGADAPGFADAGWTPVTLPHAWNARDGQDGGNNYYRGAGWYRRRLALPAAYAGRSIVLQFDGASLVADVWVNGTHVGQHRGGFATFRFDVTPLVHPGGVDVLAVRVSNAAFDDVPPLSGDFTIGGGLYRAVHVIATRRGARRSRRSRLVGRSRHHASNATTVTLRLNGVSLGPVTAPDHVFVWNGATLAPGTNHASAHTSFGSTIVSDAVDWEL